MKHVFAIVLFVIFMGCATVEPVPEAIYNGDVSFVTICEFPCKLTQDCSFMASTKATRTVRIRGFDINIAASKAGNIIFVTDANIVSNRYKDRLLFRFGYPTHAKAANDSYYVVKDVLEKAGIQIAKVTPVTSFGRIDGYLLEVYGDGYSVLRKYISRGEQF